MAKKKIAPKMALTETTEITMAFLAWQDDNIVRGLRPLSLKAYKQWWDLYFEPFTRVWCLLNQEDLVNPPYFSIGDLDDDSMAREFKIFLENKKLAPYTLNNKMRVFGAFKNFFADKGLVSAQRLKLKQAEAPVKDIYTNEEIKALCAQPKSEADFLEMRAWTIAVFVLNTGIRRGSLTEIRICDLNFTNNFVTLKHTKVGKEQIVFVPAPVMAIVKKWVAVWRSSAAPTDYVWCNQYGEHISAHYLTTIYSNYVVARLGEKTTKTSIHLARHTYAAMFCRNGGDVFTLMTQLGHSSINQSVHYAKHYSTPEPSNIAPFTPIAVLGSPTREKMKKK